MRSLLSTHIIGIRLREQPIVQSQLAIDGVFGETQ